MMHMYARPPSRLLWFALGAGTGWWWTHRHHDGNAGHSHWHRGTWECKARMNTSPTHTVHDNSYRELKEAYEAERQQQQQQPAPAPEPPQAPAGVQETRREWIWRIGNNTIRAQLTSKTNRE